MADLAEWDLERYRPLLRWLVRRVYKHLDPRLRQRFDPSDVVGSAYLKAVKNFGQFQGKTEPELRKWLEAILANTIADKIREEYAEKRNITLERSIQALVTESSDILEPFPAPNQPSPSEEAQRNERRLHVAAAIERLPDDQRDVVILHYLHDTPVADIARQFERTEKSVAGLLYRAKLRLGELLR